MALGGLWKSITASTSQNKSQGFLCNMGGHLLKGGILSFTVKETASPCTLGSSWEDSTIYQCLFLLVQGFVNRCGAIYEGGCLGPKQFK